MRTPTNRMAAVLALLVAVPFLLTGCQRGPTVQPDGAKKDIVDVVDRTTETLGGKWTVRRGPALGKCPASPGTGGVTWTYILDRDQVGDQTADRAAVQEALGLLRDHRLGLRERWGGPTAGCRRPRWTDVVGRVPHPLRRLHRARGVPVR